MICAGRVSRTSWKVATSTTKRAVLSYNLSTSAAALSGHNRWSKIKHDKGKEDAAKAKVRTALSKEIAVASKGMVTLMCSKSMHLLIVEPADGGPDPNSNPRLLHVINNAKKAGFSKSSIESAIAKGQGKSATDQALEPLIIEAMLPHNVGAMIECLTDSKARVLQDIRVTITRNGGSLSPTGFLFQRKGRNVFQKADGVGVDTVLEQAIDAGATDVELDEEGRLVIETEPNALTAVVQAMKELKLEASEIVYDPVPETMINLNDSEIDAVEGVIDLIQADCSVQNIYLNSAFSQ